MEESNETSKKRKLDDVDAEKDDPTVLKKNQKEDEQDEEIKENDGNSNEEPTKREENDNNNNTTNQDISTTKANLDVTKDNENEETKTMDNTSNDDDPKDDETKENETKRETEKPTTTTVSTGNANNVNTHSSKDKVKSDKNPYETLKWIVVKNDGRPESLIKLVALKSLFAKQLPKMPRAYIARLVFDRRHTAIAILNEDPKVKDTDEEVIGSICYRAFPEMRFAEIAFCAVNASHQVKVR